MQFGKGNIDASPHALIGASLDAADGAMCQQRDGFRSLGPSMRDWVDGMTLHARETVGVCDSYAPSVRIPARAQAHDTKQLMRISMLGGMTMEINGQEVRLNSHKATAMIAYLALAPRMRETRDRLVGLLWSESEEAKARASLRQLLHVAREGFDKVGFGGLSTEKAHVSLDGSLVTTDLDEVLATIDRGDPLDSLVNEARLTDEILRGHEDLDPSFGTWLTTKRESVRQLLIRRLEAQLSRTSHQTEATKRLASALLQIDPTHEIACQKLMCACAASGNVAGALAAYKQLWEHLEQEFDIEPSRITQGLVVALKSGWELSRQLEACRDKLDPVILLAMQIAFTWLTRAHGLTEAVKNRAPVTQARHVDPSGSDR